MPTHDLSENGHSLGYLLSLGGFQFLNVGDMTPDREHALSWRENRIGVVNLWQVPHDGDCDAIRVELAEELQPTVAIINNGPRKGLGGAIPWRSCSRWRAVGDVWQAHRTMTD